MEGLFFSLKPGHFDLWWWWLFREFLEIWFLTDFETFQNRDKEKMLQSQLRQKSLKKRKLGFVSSKVFLKIIFGSLSMKYEKISRHHGTSWKITAPTAKTCGNESKFRKTNENYLVFSMYFCSISVFKYFKVSWKSYF